MSIYSCRRRILWFTTILALCFFLLAARLFYLQVFKGPNYARAAVRQRAQALIILDGRGDILDRNGISLLDAQNEVGLVAFPTQYRGLEQEILSSLPSIQGIEQIASPPYGSLPFWLAAPINESISAELLAVPGLLPASRVNRYGSGALASHLVGYLRESEGKGVSGVELAFDDALSRGQRTVLAALVDGRSRLIPGLGYRIRKDEPSSQNVVLTIDASLQREVEQIMDRTIKQGAVVVMDPYNGDILAMASRPDFDSGSLSSYLQQGQDTLINKALWGYQPGSVFKIIVAAAALERDAVALFQSFTCEGGINVEGLYMPCSQLHPQKELTLTEAFAYSCNTVFIQLAQELGPEVISEYGRKMGLGKPTGLPVSERSGLFPETAELLNPRALANFSIGQGDLLTTPLQIAVATAVVANGGEMVHPRLTLSLTDSYGRKVKTFLPKKSGRVLNSVAVNKLKFLMQGVMDQGTGRPGKLTSAAAGVKTGTAESGRKRDGKDVYNYWAAGFYPLEKPKAVIVVMADELIDGPAVKIFGEIARYIEEN